MTPVELKEALHNGGPVFGTLIVSPSPFWPKVLGDSGLDFVFIDTEHIALDRSQVSWMCRTYKAMACHHSCVSFHPRPTRRLWCSTRRPRWLRRTLSRSNRCNNPRRSMGRSRARLVASLAGQPAGRARRLRARFNQDNLYLNIERCRRWKISTVSRRAGHRLGAHRPA